MTKKIIGNYSIAFAAALGIFLNSCSTDIDLLEEYKPITIVYGLLNTRADTQYIKVNKAFLGEGNALVMAQQRDSVNYQPGDLTVMIQKLNPFTGEVLQTITCDTTTQISKEDGTFSNPYQLLFYTTDSIYQNSNYKLIIQRHIDGATITAATPIVNDVAVTNPASPSSQIPLVNAISFAYQKYLVKWQSSANGKIYNVVVRFNYTEVLVSDTTQVAYKHIDYNLGEIVTGSTAGGDALSLELDGENFFRFIASTIPVNSAVTRPSPDSLEIIISGGAEDLYTYIEVNKPSIGLIQEKPVFTNLSANSAGIFSSRWKRSLKNKMSPATITKLQTGNETGHLFD